MKKNLSIVWLILLSFPVFSQEWRDSLETARSAYKAKNYEKALKYYQSAQKKAPKEIDLSDEMAQSAYKAREFGKAEEIYENSSSKYSDKEKKSKAYHNIGNAKMQQKKYQEAVDAYKEALRNNPRDEKTRYNLSEAMRRLKDQENKKDCKDPNMCNKPDPKKEKQNNQQNQNQQNQAKKEEENESSGENKKEGNQEKDSKSSLPNKTVDRILDKLMKQESETKRKMSGNKGEKGSAASGKDW